MDKGYNKEYEERRMAMERLWARIEAHFASKKDILAVAQRLQELETTPTIQAVQSGNNGPISVAGSDNTVHLKYENWVEGETTDAAGRRVLTYNNSSNALTAAAAAMVIKQIRGEVDRLGKFTIQIVDTVDETGRPIVPTVDFTTLYLAPRKGDDNIVGNHWVEWIAVRRPEGASTRFPYRWERVGGNEVDLTWVKNDIISLNAALKELAHRLKKVTRELGTAILDKCIKPLKELKDYINSPEFTTYIFEQLPRAGIGQDGLMTANSFAILQMLAIWVQNDRKVYGGGALSADYVIEHLDKVGVPTDTLKKDFESFPYMH